MYFSIIKPCQSFKLWQCYKLLLVLVSDEDAMVVSLRLTIVAKPQNQLILVRDEDEFIPNQYQNLPTVQIRSAWYQYRL